MNKDKFSKVIIGSSAWFGEANTRQSIKELVEKMFSNDIPVEIVGQSKDISFDEFLTGKYPVDQLKQEKLVELANESLKHYKSSPDRRDRYMYLYMWAEFKKRINKRR